MKTTLKILTVILFTGVVVRASRGADPSQSPPRVANLLLSKMTTPEKISLLSNSSPAIGRLGVEPYNWWNEALHGVMHRDQPATVFPQSLALAASFNPELVGEIGTAVGLEARALFEESRRQGRPIGQFMGITLWSPVVNLLRDPRWGRGQETFGEDPRLIVDLASAYIKGMQAERGDYLRTGATLKHFVAHSGPEIGRFDFNARITTADLWDSELRIFHEVTRLSRPLSIMTAYNSINGAPASLQVNLLQGLRRNAQFSGFVVADCGALGRAIARDKGTSDGTEIALNALEAGVDMDCGHEFTRLLPPALEERSGFIWMKTSENPRVRELANRAAGRLVRAKARLGIVGRPELHPDFNTPRTVVGSTAHLALAERAAAESVVLLENSQQTLPLNPSKIRRVLVVGPNATSSAALLGTYHGIATAPVTILEGMKSRAALSNVEIVDGGPGVPLSEELPDVIQSTCGNQPQRVFRPIPSKNFGHLDEGKNFRPGLNAAYRSRAHPGDTLEVDRVVDTINFPWGNSVPNAFLPDASVNMAEQFSVQFTGLYRATTTGIQRFLLRLDDGAMLSFNNRWLVTEFGRKGKRDICFEVSVTAGTDYPIVLDYSQYEGEAFVQLFGESEDGYAQTLAQAKAVDTVLFVGGIDGRLESEGIDRSSIYLPALQENFLARLTSDLPRTVPVVALIVGGNPLSFRKPNRLLGSLLFTSYPGERGGSALAKVLFGDLSPSGKMPATIFSDQVGMPPIDDYSMENRTYRHFKYSVQYPFGYGLTYGRTVLSNLRINRPEIYLLDPQRVTVEISNPSPIAVKEVVQLYHTPLSSTEPALENQGARIPRVALAGFKKVDLAPGQTREVEFELDSKEFANFTRSGSRWLVGGTGSIFVSTSGPINRDPALQTTVIYKGNPSLKTP